MLLKSPVVAAERAVVTFRVRVPAGTPAGDRVHVAGGAPALGDWRADGLPLERGEDGVHWARVVLERGETIQFKVTRGTWGTVEKDARGRDIRNRVLRVDGATTVDVTVVRWARTTRTGDIRFHHGFASRHLGNERSLAVYLPPGYAGGREPLPVLYMHDGQNLFDTATSAMGMEWRADETAERLVCAGEIDPLIIVGVYNMGAERAREYTAPVGEKQGRADLHTRFLVEEVKPFIDRTYRTRPGREHTAVGGSSLGGNVALYACARDPGTFSRCAAISPAVWWQGEPFLNHLAAKLPQQTRVWVQCGTCEGPTPERHERFLAGARRVVELLETRGIEHRYLEVEGAPHHEAAWGGRFHEALLYLFPRTG